MKKNIVDYKIIDVFIGRRFREERKKYGYSLSEFGALLGVTKQRYANYESALRSMPMPLYVKACRTFNIDPEELFKEAQDYMRAEVFKDASLQKEQ